MKWKRISSQLSSLQVFGLIDSNNTEAVLRYNQHQQSVRISYRNQQRLYFMEATGLSGGRFLFRNEYGFASGKLLREKFAPQGGTIELENKKFHYRLHTEPIPQIVVYEYDMVKPLVICGIAGNGNETISERSMYEFASLLLGLSWCLSNKMTASVLTDTAAVALFA